MKRRVTLIILLVGMVFIGFSQVPNQLNYQAVIRDSGGELVKNQTVDVKISIIDNLSDGTILYTEEHSKTTNDYGMLSLIIGEGNVLSGNFSDINWAHNDKFVNINVDAGDGYVDLGTTKLLTVPFAFYTNIADSARVSSYTPYAYLADSSDVSAYAYNSKIADFANNADIANTLSGGVYSTSTDTLFVVKDHDGNVVFAVFPDGAQVIVNETTKGKVGGFAVSGRSPNKAVDLDILRITPDSTRIYVNDTVSVKGKVGGFAVSGRSPNKSISTDILYVTADSTRVYVNEETPVKGKVGGFAVSGRSPNKGTINNYLQVLPDSTRIYVKDSVAGFGIANIESGTSESLLNLTKQNYLIGHNAGANLTTGKYNSMVGYEAGLAAETAYSNLFLGHRSGYSNVSGNDNVFIGNKTGFSVSGGYDNIFIGNMAGEESQSATHNTFIGNEAGKNVNGDDNICIGDRTGYNQFITTPELLSTTIVGVDAARNVTGEGNVVIGSGAGASWGGTDSGSSNVFIGVGAGAGAYTSRLGSNNICIGYNAGFGATGDNKLYIENSNDLIKPLIYGNFQYDSVIINGDFHVIGNITAIGTIVPDYVFEGDYELETIEEHANYMWTNKHLPALKSAVQIKEEGRINLNERREQMLEELEKAHIYIEQLNNDIKLMKAENQELKEKLNEIIQLLEEK